MQERLARGHNANLEPAANWDIPGLAGAGALRSTANDLFKFLEMSMGAKSTPLAAAMKMTLAERRPRQAQRDVGLGWFISSRFEDEVIWKSGGTGGYATFIGYSTRTRRNFILLSNAADYDANTNTALHFVNAAYKLPKVRRTVPVDPQLLASYTGRYMLTPTFVLTVRADGGRLFVEATGQQEYEVFAESDTSFFYRVVDAQITFDRPGNGATQPLTLTLHQNGRDRPGRRLP